MAQASGKSSDLTLLAQIEILRSIISNLADGVVVADRQGRFVFFNQAALSILGVGNKDVLPEEWPTVYGCYHSDGVTLYAPHDLPLARAIAGEAVDETEMFIRNSARPQGLWIAAKARPLRNESGELTGGAVIFRDISVERQSEERIQIFSNAVEQTADSIVITDRSGVIQYVNPAFEQTTGYTRDEAVGRTPAILKSGVHDAEFYRGLWDTIVSGRTFRATIANRKKNGEIYFAEQTITPIRDSGGQITQFVAVTKDVTEQRKLQERENQIRLARTVQQHFYEIPAPQRAGFDLAGGAFPATETGGDWFDFVALPKKRIGIAIGDVSGHGIGSALMMVELRSYLRAFASKSLDAGEIISLVNGAILSDVEQESFATIVFCRLHPPSRTLVYASAGHVPGYIFGAGGEIKRVLQSVDIPVGIMADRKFGSSEEIRLEPGEILALLTDGITEAERPDQCPFGSERALQYIRDHRDASAREIVDGLFQTVRDFADGLPQTDDITAVICKCCPQPPKQSKRRAKSARSSESEAGS